MCNCFQDIAENLKTSLKFKHPIESISPPKSFSLDSATGELRTVYILPFEVTFEGISKQKEVSIKMTFCPICGQKLNETTPSVSAASQNWVKAFAQIAKICDKITSSENNQEANDAIKKLANGEVSENALIEIKKLSYRIIESDNYDTGNMEILDIALLNLAFPN